VAIWNDESPFVDLADGTAYYQNVKDGFTREIGLAKSTTSTVTWWQVVMANSTIVSCWAAYVEPVADLLGMATARRWAHILFGTIWTALVWGLFGGTIARRSVVELGTGGTVGIKDSMTLVIQRMRSILWCLALPVLAIGMLMLFPLILGLIARAGSFGQILASLGMILAIPFMLGAGWLAIMAAGAFPLSLVAIVTEKRADAFEGLSRASAYLFQRPATVAVALLVATGLGYFAQGIVEIVAYTGRAFLLYAFEFGFGQDLSKYGSGDINARSVSILWFAHHAITLIVLAAPFSYFWTASAGLYLTLRREVDQVDFDEYDANLPSPSKTVSDGKSIAKPTGLDAEMDVAE
jgi:hypothetical protein